MPLRSILRRAGPSLIQSAPNPLEIGAELAGVAGASFKGWGWPASRADKDLVLSVSHKSFPLNSIRRKAYEIVLKSADSFWLV